MTRLYQNVYTFVYLLRCTAWKTYKDFNQYTTVTFEFCTALDLINVFYSQVETKGKWPKNITAYYHAILTLSFILLYIFLLLFLPRMPGN